MANAIHNIVLHPQFGFGHGFGRFSGSDRQTVSDDFRRFFTQIATEHEADPIPKVEFGRGFTLCVFNALLSLVY